MAAARWFIYAAVVSAFSSILGQSRAVSVLQGALASHRVHHAWIFGGPPGVGKMTTARAFAAALLDPTTAPDLAGEVGPDPDSPVQAMIRAGTHPDLHIITKELAAYSDNKKIRDAKQITIAKEVVEKRLLEPIARASTLPGGMISKAFIVDEAELLDRSPRNAPVQNSLLKTLEEPPAGSLIILVTSSEEMLLPTIRSRCQRVAFGALDAGAMNTWLERSGQEIPAEDRAWLLEFAEGSPGRFLQALEGGFAAWNRALAPMLAESDIGRFAPALASTMSEFIEGWAKKWVAEHDNASKEAANHAGTRAVLSLLAARAHRELRAAATAGSEPDLEHAMRNLELLEEADKYIAAHVGIGLTMENLAAQLSRPMLRA